MTRIHDESGFIRVRKNLEKGSFCGKVSEKSGEMEKLEKVRENHMLFPRIITIPDMEIMFFLFVYNNLCIIILNLELDLEKGIEFRHWSGKMSSFLPRKVRESQGK